MQETIKRWGAWGLFVGALIGAILVLPNAFHEAPRIKLPTFLPLTMGITGVSGALLGLACGLCVAAFRRR